MTILEAMKYVLLSIGILFFIIAIGLLIRRYHRVCYFRKKRMLILIESFFVF